MRPGDEKNPELWVAGRFAEKARPGTLGLLPRLREAFCASEFSGRGYRTTAFLRRNDEQAKLYFTN